ncbi:IS200/IS605 family transposase [Carboxylicivirga sp. M1479]|uniref:IS200/IS605 family transposase n=1 Tax=Carboxylicivirga sp. M1479 TaxID=2594476 RepID=UPI0011777CA1|nr:IS200/IS605 family transposase [Carboxylicivirga sp. M1479]TRX63273.1 IS200/IS605 family transposase [Carboxylicivirga sp. M1479]
MSTYTQILYQIVFSTKRREKTLINRERLYKYIWGILREKNCHLYRIGGVEDHVHIVVGLHPMVAPALLVKDIKLSTSNFIVEEKLFPQFTGWQDGYGAFTYHVSSKNDLIEYVKNQEIHHQEASFKEEYISLLSEHGIAFEEKYLF